MDSSIIEIEKVSYSYGARKALDTVSFSVATGEIFGLLGPNGGGKTTLFKILTTLVPYHFGNIKVFGYDLKKDFLKIRKQIGVVFQSPSLDKKLTVAENLLYQGQLYGLSGQTLRKKIEEILERIFLKDRAKEIVEKLSGGLQRRVEIGKSLLHQPRLIFLDEPTAGLDPGVRKDLWSYLYHLSKEEKITLFFTTHLLEEAERCRRLAILNEGKLIALDQPDLLRKRIGEETITIYTDFPDELSKEITKKTGLVALVFEDSLRINQKIGATAITEWMKIFSNQIRSLTIGKPTLEDVFIHFTGHRFWSNALEKKNQMK